LLLYENPDNKEHARNGRFHALGLQDGQPMAAELGYAPLPAGVVQQELEHLKRIKVQ
jgi:hypothetical protein